MKFEHTEVFNFEGALRGMRNPLNSWAKSDSYWRSVIDEEATSRANAQGCDIVCYKQQYTLGPNDMDLARRLINGGSEHRKFLRQIMVSVDITAPLFWWKEFDTYKVGTTANSTSTMHKLASTEITLDCFEIDDLATNLKWSPSFLTGNENEEEISFNQHITSVLHHLEGLRLKYNETKDKRYWKELIRWLPNGWLQTRTITMNYENLRSMYHQREHHKLTEWHTFCDWIKELPYAQELIIN